MSAPERSLATVLFTDIVGSTGRATELGDSRWRELLQEHDVAVRRELKRCGGREVSTTGDGFLAVFDGPARAILCAGAIRDAVKRLDLGIRCGLHMGEVERTGRTLGGIGVHIAARVMAEAGPGEVLVSRSVRDAVEGAGFRFEDRGARTLKGVAGERRLFALTAVPEDAGTLPLQRWRPQVTRPQTLVGGTVAIALLAGLGGLFLARRETGSKLSPEVALAAGAAPGIAVLPFQVADPNLAVWREGIVDLLTTNLDGMGGLRAIDSRTVLAQWHEGVSEGQVPDLRTILEIARDAGGSYAVVGSAVTIGPDMRLSATVYELERGAVIGAARAEGPRDSIYTLVDSLSIDVLRAILKGDADKLPADPDLASVTTASIPALKAYLEGEALYRKAAFENAILAYQRAVAADSTFALAWLRLAGAEWWSLNNAEIMDEIDRALALSDKLSQREVMVAKATRAFLVTDRFRTRELASMFLHFYPDDPDIWFFLAMSFGDRFNEPDVPGDPADGERALLRAVELDPTFAPYRIGLLYRSFWEADREQVIERLEALAGLVREEDEIVKSGRLAYALAWGDSATRSRTWATVDTLDAEFLLQTTMFLNNGRFLPISEALHRQPQARVNVARWCRTCLSMILLWEGKFQEEIRLLDHPLVRFRPVFAYNLHFFGMSLPESLERDLAFQAVETDTFSWFFAGAYAADRGRWPDHAAVLQALRTAARHAGRDSIDSRAFGGTANALEGYGLWKRGRASEALPLLTAGQRDMVGPFPSAGISMLANRWIGLLLLELGQPAEAVPYLQTLWPGSIIRDPFAAYEIGRAYAELGENRNAIEAYEEALAAWRDADPVLKPRIETARREIARLRARQ